MANVLVERSYLEDIADSIRGKLGVADTYKPSEMSDAIDSISGGGITPTGTINISSNGTHDVTQYATAAVAVPNSYSASDEGKVVDNGALVSQTSDTVTQNGTIDTTLINSLTVNVSGGGGDHLAELCNNTLVTYHSEDVTELHGAAFREASALTKIVLPNLTNIRVYNVFTSCTNLEAADFGGTFGTLQNNTFSSCSKLATLIIRNTTACNLGNINAFASTPFASGGTGGTLYVPQSLISTYQGKSNWSTILGYANNSIQKIEGSIYETAYADGTPIT